MPRKSSFNMVWMDMEMTGLHPARDVILEIATIVTDRNLNVLAEGPCLAIACRAKRLRGMDEWNKKHHKASGLLKRVRASRVSVKKAERLTLEFIKKYTRPGAAPLCGNSIHQDRRFIYKYMPNLNRHLHFRNVDVTSIKELLRRWYPDTPYGPKKKKAHKAMSDVRESIAELKYYREHFFVK